MDNIRYSLIEVHKDLSDRLKREKTLGRTDSLLEKELADVADSLCLIDDYTNYLRDTDKEYKTDVLDELDKLKSENIQLREKVETLKYQRDTLLNSYNTLVDYSGLLKQTKKTIDTFNAHMEQYKEDVDSAKKQIALKKYIGSDEFKERDFKGEKAHRYRQDVKNDDIIAKYNSGLSVKEIAQTYGMTETGMRLRLQNIGVWEDRRKKKAVTQISPSRKEGTT